MGPQADSHDAAPRRRADAERNERQIVEAAAEVLWREPNATIGEIALASGLGRATIYRHFPTRDDLLRGMSRHGMEQTAQALRDARPDEGTAVEALTRMLAATLKPSYVCIVALNQMPELVASTAEKGEMLAPVVQALQRGMASGELRSDLDIAWTMRVLNALFREGMEIVAAGEQPAEEVRRLIAATVFEGLLPRA